MAGGQLLSKKAISRIVVHQYIGHTDWYTIYKVLPTGTPVEDKAEIRSKGSTIQCIYDDFDNIDFLTWHRMRAVYVRSSLTIVKE